MEPKRAYNARPVSTITRSYVRSAIANDHPTHLELVVGAERDRQVVGEDAGLEAEPRDVDGRECGVDTVDRRDDHHRGRRPPRSSPGRRWADRSSRSAHRWLHVGTRRSSPAPRPRPPRRPSARPARLLRWRSTRSRPAIQRAAMPTAGWPGPRGIRRVSAIRPAPPGSVSSRWSSPYDRHTSSAAQRKVDDARVTSPRAHTIGLPFSSTRRSANSAARSSSRRAT